MSLTKDDIEIIEEIIRIKVKKNLKEYILSRPYVLKMTYDEMEKELVKIQEDFANIPIVKVE